MISIDEQVETLAKAVKANATVDSAIQYAKDIVAGEIVAGKKMKQACQRFLTDLEQQDKSGFKFSRKRAERALKFFPLFCCHIKGSLAGQPIVLEDWQAFIIVNIFGWFQKSRAGKWVRRFRYVYIEVARKNGKSTLLSGIALYMMVFDGEGGAEIYCAAVDKDQARIVWEASAAMIEKSLALSSVLKVTRSKYLVELVKNYSVFLPLSRDTKKMDGLNVHCGILDEVHAHPDRKVFDLVKDGMSSREQPLLAMITTAGTNKLGVCFEQRKHVANILSGDTKDKESERYFGAIFDLDDEDEPYDEEAWKKANPCLGKAKLPDAMDSQAALSKISAIARINFLIKDLNRWLDGGIRWIDLEKWKACASNKDFESKEDLRNMPCWLGVDLSIKGDVTALVLVFQGLTQWYVKTELIYPKHSITDLSDEKKQLFKDFVNSGHLTLVNSYMVETDVVEKRITELKCLYNIQEVCLDPWKSHQLTKKLNDKGIEGLHVGQTVKNFSETMQTIDGYIDEKKIVHDDNPMMNWMMGNVEVSMDKNDNIFPYKAENDRENKIDGPTAFFTAMFRAMVSEPEQKSVYDRADVTC